MAIINKMYLKDANGVEVPYDIGASAENVAYNNNTSIKGKIDTVNENLVNHTSKTVVSQNGVHDIRYQNKLQIKNNGVWIDVTSDASGSMIDVIGPNVSIEGQSAYFTQCDPDESEWSQTSLVMKAGTAPETQDTTVDPDVVVIGINTIKNQYASTTRMSATGLSYNTVYYFRFFIGLDTTGSGNVDKQLPGTSIKVIPSNGIIDIAHGGTGNADGYIRTGQANGSTIGTKATAEGSSNVSSANQTHAEGYLTTASGNQAHSEGNSTYASGGSSHAEGSRTSATNSGAHAEGYNTQATGQYSHAEGSGSKAVGNYSHAEGSSCTADQNYSHAEGLETSAAYGAHAEGRETYAGQNSHAEGENTSALGTQCHGEGVNIYISADAKYCHAEGQYSYIKGSAQSAHAEGLQTTASAIGTHAEGGYTLASKNYAHAEGVYTTASGENSHSEGFCTIASNKGSRASGQYLKCSGLYSTIIGEGKGEENVIENMQNDTFVLTNAKTSKFADYGFSYGDTGFCFGFSAIGNKATSGGSDTLANFGYSGTIQNDIQKKFSLATGAMYLLFAGSHSNDSVGTPSFGGVYFIISGGYQQTTQIKTGLVIPVKLSDSHNLVSFTNGTLVIQGVSNYLTQYSLIRIA